MKALNYFFFLLIVMSSCSNEDEQMSEPTPDETELELVTTIKSGEMDRDFTLFLPAGWNNKKYPLLILLHGGNSDMFNMVNLSNFKGFARENSIALVFPNAFDKNWNDGRILNALGDTISAVKAGVDDVLFISDLIDHLEQRYNIDEKRVYSTGISNGANMSMRLGCELSNKIAGASGVAGTMAELTFNTCSPDIPIPIVLIHGTADPLFPINGMSGVVVSHQSLIDKWLTEIGANNSPVETKVPDNFNDGTTVTKRVFSGQNGLKVWSYIVNDGGHTWPRGVQYLPERTIGKTSQEIDATAEIWNNLKRYSR